MAIERPLLIKQELSPAIQMEAVEMPNLAQELVQSLSKFTGSYVFLYDYQTRIYSQEAKKIMEKSPIGSSYTLPKGSFYDLKYSKGDIVEVIGLQDWVSAGSKKIVIGSKQLAGGVREYDLNKLVLRVPLYVKPISTDALGAVGFLPTMTIDNSVDVILKKIPNTTPTKKLGVNFGNNPRPKVVYVNPTPTPTTGTTTTPVITNGIQDTTETNSFFDDKNNLLTIAGVLLIGYLLLNNKSE
jgi:hypothetical protein